MKKVKFWISLQSIFPAAKHDWALDLIWVQNRRKPTLQEPRPTALNDVRIQLTSVEFLTGDMQGRPRHPRIFTMGRSDTLFFWEGLNMTRNGEGEKKKKYGIHLALPTALTKPG